MQLCECFVLAPSSGLVSCYHNHNRLRLVDYRQSGCSVFKNENDEPPPLPSEADENDPQAKPMSRLAMAAADWMEDDELQTYWDRYDAAKSNSSNGNKNRDNMRSTTSVVKSAQEDEILTTEERLDRYFQSRGIDKSLEKKHAKDIKRAATYAAKSASGALDAIQTLEQVRPYMQVGSKLGGTALLELAYAYQAHSENEEKGNDKYEDEFREICYSIIDKNPLRELRLRAKQLLEDPKRHGRKYEKRSFWKSFDSLWS